MEQRTEWSMSNQRRRSISLVCGSCRDAYTVSETSANPTLRCHLSTKKPASTKPNTSFQFAGHNPKYHDVPR